MLRSGAAAEARLPKPHALGKNYRGGTTMRKKEMNNSGVSRELLILLEPVVN
jgi:hypothetical protein